MIWVCAGHRWFTRPPDRKVWSPCPLCCGWVVRTAGSPVQRRGGSARGTDRGGVAAALRKLQDDYQEGPST